MRQTLKQPLVLASIIVAIGLVIMGESLRCGLNAVSSGDHRVTVKGLATRDVAADRVTWPLVYKELSNDPAEMYAAMQRKNAIITRFLTEGGLTADEIIINPPTITDRLANMYTPEGVRYRYEASISITVISSNVDCVRGLLNRQAELMTQGVTLVHDFYNGVFYEFTGLNDIKPEMVEEATRAARATAQKFAADSESELGGIISASQGQFSIEDSDSSAPHIKHVRVVTTVEYEIK